MSKSPLIFSVFCPFSALVSTKYYNQSSKKPKASAKASPKIIPKQHAAMPFEQNKFIKLTIIIIRAACSIICPTEFGKILRFATKYPLKTEDAAIKGRDSGKILSEITVRLSPKMVVPIKLAPKIIIIADMPAIKKLSKSDVRSTFLQFCGLFFAISSAQRRVTAVQIPLVAKVDAKT